MIWSSAFAQEFKSYSVQYQLNGKSASNTIYIPDNSSKLPIRGVMQNVRGSLKEFAHKHQIALFDGLDQGRGFTKELLIAAAKAADRPEIEFAGAIVQGISRGGREAADWAAENKERAVAIILDHSAIWHMNFPKRVTGVPMYFNATYADLYQKIDRRKSHFQWCTEAFKAKQACTAIIDHVKNGGHGGRGSTDLTAIWLEEAMACRVPVNIPVGKPYQLIDVYPSKGGAFVSAKILMDGDRSYHDNVKITLKRGSSNWWIPGPKTAAKYLEWVRKNGGTVEKDESAGIINFPVFVNPSAILKRVIDLIKRNQWAQAFNYLNNGKNSDDSVTELLTNMIENNIQGHIYQIERLNDIGDLYSVFNLLKENSRYYKGIPACDEKFKFFAALFKDKKNLVTLKQGRDFHNIIDRINKTKKLNNLAPLRTFIKKHGYSSYGKAAQITLDKLTADLSLKLPPQNYFIN